MLTAAYAAVPLSRLAPSRRTCSLLKQFAFAALNVAAVILSVLVLISCASAGEADVTRDVTQGALRIVQKNGDIVECPLKHTDVKADVSGFLARVTVTQTFANPLDKKIEAVYVFPLPHEAAVDNMTMVIGERRIIGLIKRRDEARQIYEQALLAGQTAALLEQERPNIFTQSVGNIPPKQEVKIEISYVDVLKYDQGAYEFHFPMVVGPRYIPGNPESSTPPVPPELKGNVGELRKNEANEGAATPKGSGWSPDTDRVGDASRITPPVLKPGMRNGHDIALSLTLDAGVPVQNLKVINHQADVKRDGQSKATVVMSPADAVPNKDFVLRYAVMGAKPEVALLTHADGSMGYFMLMVQPKEDERLKLSPPREIVFLVDVSGSMGGKPTEKVKQTMRKMLTLCRDKDTIQVITFANQANKLFEAPVPVNEENIRRALDFTKGLKGGGGTEMLKGIKLAIGEPPDQERVRIVMLLTDGYIGNEAEIIKEVGSRCGDRIKFWCLGIGNAVNRFLLDGVAKQSGGMGKVVNLNEDPEATVQEVMARIHSAQLAKIKLNFGDMTSVCETFPARLPDLWSGRPVIVYGLYNAGDAKKTSVTISGEIEGQSASWPIAVDFPAARKENEVLATVWARQKIEDLMQQTYYAGSPEVAELVTSLALEFRIMSQYTSFVAVDESEAKKLEPNAKPPRRMLVPVPIPEGTSYAGFFGDEYAEGKKAKDFGMMVDVLRSSTPSKPQQAMFKQRASFGPVGEKLGYKPDAFAMRATDARAGGFGYGGRTRGNVSVGGAANLNGLALRAVAAAQPPAATPAPVATTVSAPQGAAAANMDASKTKLEGNEFAAAFDGDLQTMNQQLTMLQQRAALVLKEAEEQQKKGDFAQARATYTFAMLLQSTLAAQGWGGGDSRAESGEDACRAELLKTWTKTLSALDKKLDLVIRDKPLSEALELVAKASGLKAELLAGSLEDSCANLGVKEARVTFLDLRRATAAQALDWLLHPARLTWWAGENGVTAASARLAPAQSAWVYDVRSIAAPSKTELESAKEADKRAKAVRETLDEFVAAVRKTLELKDDTAFWYAPGQLLVVGDAKTHAAAAKLFADLANPDAKLDDMQRFHKTTAERAAQRKDANAALLQLNAQRRLAETLLEHSWALLAATAAGKVDLEALTELQVAWKDAEMPALLKGSGVHVALRSLYAIVASADALPKNEELAALAKQAQTLARAAAEDAVAAVEKRPEYGISAVYAALALHDPALAQRARSALAQVTKSQPGQAFFAAIAEVLNPQPDAAALAALVRERGGELRGDDVVFLTALACRRAGGEAWNAFRAAAPDTLGQQALDGNVIVLVNGLSWTALPIR